MTTIEMTEAERLRSRPVGPGETLSYPPPPSRRPVRWTPAWLAYHDTYIRLCGCVDQPGCRCQTV